LGRRSVNVRFGLGSWFDALPDELCGQLDLVVANPPYIADDDPEIETQVRDFEPSGALFAGPDGLDAIRQIVADAPAWLAPGGWLLIEIGHRQGNAVLDLLRSAGLVSESVEPDLTGRDRFAVARRPA
jgi:release factor glutamine methyltransferase